MRCRTSEIYFLNDTPLQINALRRNPNRFHFTKTTTLKLFFNTRIKQFYLSPASKKAFLYKIKTRLTVLTHESTLYYFFTDKDDFCCIGRSISLNSLCIEWKAYYTTTTKVVGEGTKSIDALCA